MSTPAGGAAPRRLPAAALALGAAVLGVLALLLVVWLAGRPARLTLTNAGLVLQSAPRERWLALAAPAAALASWALLRRARHLRVARAVLLLVLGAGWQAASLGAYRVALDDGGLSARGLLGSDELAWGDVQRVESGRAALLLLGRGDRQVRLDTGRLSPEQRATFERAIARRVREVTAGRDPVQ